MKKYWKYALVFGIIKKALIPIFLLLISSCTKDEKESFLVRYNGINWELENPNDGFRPIESNEVLMFSSGTSFYNTAIIDQALWDDEDLDGFWPCKSFEEGDNYWIGGQIHNFKILKNNFNELLYEYRIENELIGQYEFTYEGESLRCTFKSNFGILSATLIKSNESLTDWCEGR
tara:strand:- start:571 stop:1095 length:525 start_codon:yes stop_codon:yes gene_type:complete